MNIQDFDNDVYLLFAAIKWYRTTNKKRTMPIKLENIASCISEIILKVFNFDAK